MPVSIAADDRAIHEQIHRAPGCAAGAGDDAVIRQIFDLTKIGLSAMAAIGNGANNVRSCVLPKAMGKKQDLTSKFQSEGSCHGVRLRRR